MGINKFRVWMKEKYGSGDIPLISKSDFDGGEFNETVSRYGEFSCETAARTAEHFSKALKEYINNEQIVGIFYGYNAYVNDYLWGHHGMRFIIDSPYIDFFSSPCGYDNSRGLGVDWSDMLTTESLKIHGKLYFVECDIRTHLTRRMQDSRPGIYPDGIYTLYNENGNKTVWCGPETPELSLSAIRKAFAHQLTKGSGIWWFDMWGGWYHDNDIISELKKMKTIAESSKEKNAERYPSAQVVMFIDEKAYLNNPRDSHLCHSVNITRSAMGNTGIPFDLCMVEDAEKALNKYRAAIFTAPLPSESGKKALNICRNLNIPYISADTENSFFGETQLRDFLLSSNIHCYNSDGNVICCVNGFLGIHSVKDGIAEIKLPAEYTVRPLLGTSLDECRTDRILIDMNKHDTAVFELI